VTLAGRYLGRFVVERPCSLRHCQCFLSLRSTGITTQPQTSCDTLPKSLSGVAVTVWDGKIDEVVMSDKSTDEVVMLDRPIDEVAMWDRSTGEVAKKHFKNPPSISGPWRVKFNMPPFFCKGESTSNCDGPPDPKYCAAGWR
jgi:hypothetical protein